MVITCHIRTRNMRNWASTHIIMDLYNINSKNDFTKKKRRRRRRRRN